MENKSRFTLEDWDAPVYIGAEELRHALVHMELENKVIAGFRLLDYSSVKLPEWDQTEEEVMIPVFAALSSPMIVLFTDGTRLEMYMQDQSVFRLSINSIPLEAIREEVTFNTLDRLFYRALGTSIVFIEVQVTEDFPEVARDYADEFKKHMRTNSKSIRNLSTPCCSVWIPGMPWNYIPGDSRARWIL